MSDSELMKGWRFDARSESGVRQSSSSSLPTGQVFRHRSGSGDDGCLAGRLTGAQSQVSEARHSRSCGVLQRGVIDEVESAAGVRNERRTLSRHRFKLEIHNLS